MVSTRSHANSKRPRSAVPSETRPPARLPSPRRVTAKPVKAEGPGQEPIPPAPSRPKKSPKRRKQTRPAKPASHWHPTVAPDIEDAVDLSSRARVVHDALAADGLAFSAPEDDVPRRTVLDSLFATILSQATTNVNSSRAFGALKNRFPDWESARRAGAEEIEVEIRCSGLSKVKSERMYHILCDVHEEYGDYTLETLRDMGDSEAIAKLTKYKGVG